MANDTDGVALPAAPEIQAWMWQHDETGRVGFIDQWQVDNGWQAANPRLRLIRPLVFAAGVALPAAPEIQAWMWQHDETGRVGFIDQWQVDNGWQAANPRLRLIRPLVFAAGVQPSAAECRHCDRRAASWGVVRPGDFHYEDCPQHISGVPGTLQPEQK